MKTLRLFFFVVLTFTLFYGTGCQSRKARTTTKEQSDTVVKEQIDTVREAVADTSGGIPVENKECEPEELPKLNSVPTDTVVFNVFPSLDKVKDTAFRNILAQIDTLQLDTLTIENMFYKSLPGRYFPDSLAERIVCKNLCKIHKDYDIFENCRQTTDSMELNYAINCLLPTNGKFIMVLFQAMPFAEFLEFDFAHYFIMTFNLEGEFISGYFCGSVREYWDNKANLSFAIDYAKNLTTNRPTHTYYLQFDKENNLKDIEIYREDLYINDTGRIFLVNRRLLASKKNLNEKDEQYGDWTYFKGDSVMYYLKGH